MGKRSVNFAHARICVILVENCKTSATNRDLCTRVSSSLRKQWHTAAAADAGTPPPPPPHTYLPSSPLRNPYVDRLCGIRAAPRRWRRQRQHGLEGPQEGSPHPSGWHREQRHALRGQAAGRHHGARRWGLGGGGSSTAAADLCGSPRVGCRFCRCFYL